MVSASNDKKDYRAVAKALDISYTAASDLIEKREQAADFEPGTRLDYRNMTVERIREIFPNRE